MESRPIDLGELLGRKLQESQMKDLYRSNMESLQAQRANDTQYGGDHYKKMRVQPWDTVDEWPIEQQIGYHRGNILKYTMRMGSKGERLKEAQKIKHYAQKLVEILEAKDGNL